MADVYNLSTDAGIVLFLRDKLEESGWPRAPVYCGRGCHCIQGYGCSYCGAEGEHKPDCRGKRMLQQIDAFVQKHAPQQNPPQEEEDAPCSDV